MMIFGDLRMKSNEEKGDDQEEKSHQTGFFSMLVKHGFHHGTMRSSYTLLQFLHEEPQIPALDILSGIMTDMGYETWAVYRSRL